MKPFFLVTDDWMGYNENVKDKMRSSPLILKIYENCKYCMNENNVRKVVDEDVKNWNADKRR